MATSELDKIDPFEPDALDVAVDTYSEEVPLMAQIGIGMTPAGLAVDAAEIAKYGRDAYRAIESGDYNKALLGAAGAGLGIAGLVPIAGDILKYGGKTLLKNTDMARQYQPKIKEPVNEPDIQQVGGKKLFGEVEKVFKEPQQDIVDSEQLIQRAIDSNASFQKEIKDIADNLNLEKTPSTKVTETGNVINIEVKSKESIDSKLARKPYGAEGITDTIRTRVFVETADDADAVAKQVAEKFPTIDTKFQSIPENGYFDRKLNVQHVNPKDGKVILAEISMTTKPMAEAVDKAHKLYEKERDLLKGKSIEELPFEARNRVNALQQEQRQVYGEALRQSHPSIIEQVIPKFRYGGYVSGRSGRSTPIMPNSSSKSSLESFVPSSKKSTICSPEAATQESSVGGRKKGFANSSTRPINAGPFSQAKKSVISIKEYLLNPDGNANDVVYVNVD